MSVAGINSAKGKALPSTSTHPINAIRAGGIVVSWQKTAVIAMAVMILCGAGLRLKGLGAVGFAEDEINKIEAARAYDRGDFTANAEDARSKTTKAADERERAAQRKTLCEDDTARQSSAGGEGRPGSRADHC